MNEYFVPGVGAVLSADIAIPNRTSAQRFYSHVLGTGEEPLWGADLRNNFGMSIIGLGARTEEHAALPVQWMPHIQVADVAASVERALALGGRELMHERDDDGSSQWAVLLDPNGAAFGLVQVVAPEALPDEESIPEEEPVGHIAWLDITVADAEATRDFYREVVGWTVEDIAMDDDGEAYADYSMVGEEGTMGAGVCHARGAIAGLPPVWIVYLPVGDLAESLRRVALEGGEVVWTMPGEDGAVAYAIIQDPAGAHLGLLQD